MKKREYRYCEYSETIRLMPENFMIFVAKKSNSDFRLHLSIDNAISDETYFVICGIDREAAPWRDVEKLVGRLNESALSSGI